MQEINNNTSEIDNNEPILNNVNNTDERRTYSAAELSDPSDIDVSIADKVIPIVVLFGPPACGKTMTMIRLAEYLTDTNQGYEVNPIRSFRPGYDTTYEANCNDFKNMLRSKRAAEKSEGLDFMLLEVKKEGQAIVQILEAPGEHYYNPSDANEPSTKFIRYVTNIIQSSNRKIWICFTEPNWKEDNDRIKYTKKIAELRKKMRPRDRTIVLLNKVDEAGITQRTGALNMKSAKREVTNKYPGLFDIFKNEHPISSIWKPYNCTFLPFQTGDFKNELRAGLMVQSYVQGPDSYPMSLWNAIMKSIGFRL